MALVSTALRYAGTNALPLGVTLSKAFARLVRAVGIANSAFVLSVTAAFLLQVGQADMASRACLVAGTVVTYWVGKHMMVRTLGLSGSTKRCKRNHRRCR